MKHWQDVLGHIRLLGPDIPVFREDVKFINDHIEKLEREARRTAALAFVIEKGMVKTPEGRDEERRDRGGTQPVPIDENWPGYEC